VTYIAIASRFSLDSDSGCRREVAVNDGQYLKLPATFHLFFAFGKLKVLFEMHNFGHII